jgi:hypothetical protein
MLTTNRKLRNFPLVRVADGLYRNEAGTMTVRKVGAWRGKPAVWKADFTNVFGSRVFIEAPTLAAMKHHLATGQPA